MVLYCYCFWSTSHVQELHTYKKTATIGMYEPVILYRCSQHSPPVMAHLWALVAFNTLAAALRCHWYCCTIPLVLKDNVKTAKTSTSPLRACTDALDPSHNQNESISMYRCSRHPSWSCTDIACLSLRLITPHLAVGLRCDLYPYPIMLLDESRVSTVLPLTLKDCKKTAKTSRYPLPSL